MREAIAAHYRERGAPNAIPERMFIGNGVSELIDIALRALLNPGDEVLVPSPDYPLWTAATILNDGVRGALRVPPGKRLPARCGADRIAGHAAHARDRDDQSEQSDRRGVSARVAGADLSRSRASTTCC